jgi:hypothetical protein
MWRGVCDSRYALRSASDARNSLSQTSAQFLRPPVLVLPNMVLLFLPSVVSCHHDQMRAPLCAMCAHNAESTLAHLQLPEALALAAVPSQLEILVSITRPLLKMI